ncbi:MAG: chorismate dehydratase [Planctomycetota bacterium]|nr:MAG: chorismate dehydratase [Planctomycetota bacterium]
MLRLGTVPYLNALPLVEGLHAQHDVELVARVPSELAPRLRAGELDAALVSAVELFRTPTLSWVRGPAVISRGAVRSILLFLRCPLSEVRSLALDRSSLSAAALTQVVLRRFAGLAPLELQRSDPERALHEIDADAVLRIGDPALRTDPGQREVLDVGAFWQTHSGLPFVYALWLVRPEAASPELAARLVAAAAAGHVRRHALALEFAAEHAMDPDACSTYLHESIAYDFGPREQAGLALFGRLAHGLGLVDQGVLPDPVA